MHSQLTSNDMALIRAMLDGKVVQFRPTNSVVPQRWNTYSRDSFGMACLTNELARYPRTYEFRIKTESQAYWLAVWQERIEDACVIIGQPCTSRSAAVMKCWANGITKAIIRLELDLETLEVTTITEKA
jgi:hypothetical protein